MKVTGRLAWLAIALGLSVPCLARQQSGTTPHAGMLRFPAVSATRLAFVYAGRLWTAPHDGGLASPLAAPAGSPAQLRFSPDGKTLAFAANYEGNRDLYTIPVEGGLPFRVTHHPSTETLSSWTPDGKLLFAASGYQGMGRMRQLFTVPATGGLPTMLPVPYGENGVISADGKTLAYMPFQTDGRTWKRYRGGMATDIWLFDLQSHKSKRLTDWEGTDTQPMWQGDRVYYISDMGPEHRENLWVVDTRTGKREQVTRYADDDVHWASMGPGAKGQGEIVFQHGTEMCLLDLATRQAQAVSITIPGDRPTLQPRTVDASRFINSWSISPTGKRAAATGRGDLWTLPAKDGMPRNLTRSAGSNERNAGWSPDGRWIAFTSDRTGEYELYITQSDGKGETRALTHDTKTFYYDPTWSPNSKQIAMTDKAGRLLLVEAAAGGLTEIDVDPDGNRAQVSWSSDSRWIAYTRTAESSRQSCLWVYDTEARRKTQLTSGIFPDFSPTFDRKGDYLYYVTGRTFRPTYEDFGTTWIYTNALSLVVVPLRAEVGAPLPPKVDEEKWGDGPAGDKPKTVLDVAAEVTAAQADEVSGTWSGTASGSLLPGGTMPFTANLKLGANNECTGTLDSSIGSMAFKGLYTPSTHELSGSCLMPTGETLTVVVRISGNSAVGSASAAGQAFEVKMTRAGAPTAPTQPPAQQSQATKPADAAPKVPARVEIELPGFEARAVSLGLRPGRFGDMAVNDRNQLIFVRSGNNGTDDPPAIKLFDITDEKREEKVVAAGAGGFAISADGKKLLVVRGGSASIQDASAGSQAEAVPTAGMTMRIDPREEWRQIVLEAWRTERDFFYDPGMHGLDWAKVRDHYMAMLPDCASRADVSLVIGEMIGELNVGHAYYMGGESDPQPSVPVGMLGADFELANGAYRISAIYQGGAWDIDARGILGLPGAKAKVGDYLLAVNGVPVDTTQDPWAAFVGLADKTVTVTVGDKPTLDASAREVPLRLMGDDGNLRYRAWIEANRAKVARKSGGRVGYIYVPNTGENGQSDLLRQFIGQRGADALIIDERWNGGGQVPNRFIELLNRPISNYWTGRHGRPTAYPPDGHAGPKCMLINGLAGSGGDLFPYLFRHAGLGKLLGTRTWGGVVGIGGYPGLVDGAAVTAPNFAFFESSSKWGIEGHGVDPDIEVIDDPALMLEGGDPQLDAAVDLMLAELKKNPPSPVAKPPFPDRSGMGVPKKDR